MTLLSTISIGLIGLCDFSCHPCLSWLKPAIQTLPEETLNTVLNHGRHEIHERNHREINRGVGIVDVATANASIDDHRL